MAVLHAIRSDIKSREQQSNKEMLNNEYSIFISIHCFLDWYRATLRRIYTIRLQQKYKFIYS